MKKVAAALPLPMALAASPAFADAYDCFPVCPAESGPAATLDLCENRAVREVAKAERKLAPVKEIYGIATNPTGYAIRLVDRHVVHIPEWVGYAIDPKGAIKAKAMERVRHGLKKQVGLERHCEAEPVTDR